VISVIGITIDPLPALASHPATKVTVCIFEYIAGLIFKTSIQVSPPGSETY
jgi:hypothetical protein